MFASTLMQFASARPFNATTGLDNNGDGADNDRPVLHVIGPGEQAPHVLALRADGSHPAARVTFVTIVASFWDPLPSSPFITSRATDARCGGNESQK